MYNVFDLKLLPYHSSVLLTPNNNIDCTMHCTPDMTLADCLQEYLDSQTSLWLVSIE